MEAALIEAATALFAERGYESTKTRMIAERVGCSEALIQNYFGGKDGLLLAVMRSGGEWETYLAFFRRPLCASMEEEAAEHLTYVIKGLTARAPYLRILVSRALVDPSFQASYGEYTLRKQVLAALTERFDRCRQTGMLSDSVPISAVAEWLVDMGFHLGFIHPHLLGHKPAQVTGLARDFARLFGRAVQHDDYQTSKEK